MKRLRKVLLWVFGVTAGLLIVAWFGIKGYINSSYGRQTAAAQLTNIVGLPVEVESLSVGTGTTSASLKINDTTPEAPGELLKVGSLETDISLLDLLSGRVAPTTVTLKDVEFLLRLDAEGKILSPLPKLKSTGDGPKTIPAVELVGGRVRIQQTGHPEFDAKGLNAKVVQDGDAYTITGTGDDPKWGKWTITGRITAQPAGGKVQFHTDRTTVNVDMLKSIPYVPLTVWDEVVPNGDTAATVTLDYQPDRGMAYGVDLKLLKASLGIPAVWVVLNQVEGDVKIGDDKVLIRGGHGVLAGGDVTTDGTYDFSKPAGVFTSKITTNKVDVKQLPDEWGLKRFGVGGKLKGDADIELRFPPAGKVETNGNGKGELEGATILNGIPAVIKLRMKGDKNGFQFLPL